MKYVLKVSFVGGRCIRLVFWDEERADRWTQRLMIREDVTTIDYQRAH